MPVRGCRTRFGVRSRGSLASATCAPPRFPLRCLHPSAPRGSRPPAATRLRFPALSSLPFPSWRKSDSRISRKKKVVVTPFLPINAPVPPAPRLVLPPPATGCGTIQRFTNSCRLPPRCERGERGSSHTSGDVWAITVGFIDASEAGRLLSHRRLGSLLQLGQKSRGKTQSDQIRRLFSASSPRQRRIRQLVINFLFYLEISSRNTGE